MRLVLSVVLLSVLFSSLAHAAPKDPAPAVPATTVPAPEDFPQDAEGIRTKMLKEAAVQKEKGLVTQPIYDEYVRMVKDDSAPIDSQHVAQLFEIAKPTHDEQMERFGFVIAMLFRERDKPETITAMFDRLNASEQNVVLGLLITVYKPLINREYLPLALKGLSRGIDSAEAAEAGNKEYLEDMARTWIEVAALTGDPSAGSKIKPILSSKVVSPNFRFNLVGNAMAKLKVDAVPIAQWYFQRYAWEPFQVATILSFLRKYEEPETVNALVLGKEIALRESLKALNPDYKIPGSSPSTTLPAAPSSQPAK